MAVRERGLRALCSAALEEADEEHAVDSHEASRNEHQRLER
jgi:hypothetical protein